MTGDCFCQACYTAAIERLCAGFAIVKTGGKRAVAVPPLPPGMALLVRRAAAAHLAARGAGDTARHPGHMRSWK